MLRLVGESLQKTVLVLLSVQAYDKRLQREGGHPAYEKRFRRYEMTRDGRTITHFSAWRTRRPVMSSIGKSL